MDTDVTSPSNLAFLHCPVVVPTQIRELVEFIYICIYNIIPMYIYTSWTAICSYFTVWLLEHIFRVAYTHTIRQIHTQTEIHHPYAGRIHPHFTLEIQVPKRFLQFSRKQNPSKYLPKSEQKCSSKEFLPKILKTPRNQKHRFLPRHPNPGKNFKILQKWNPNQLHIW